MKKLDTRSKDFTEAYSNYYPLVFSTINTKINDIDTVKDLSQEVFIRFYEKYDEVENHRKWLLGTLRYVVLEHYKRKGSRDLDIEDVFEDLSLTFVNGFKDTRVIIEEALEDTNNFEDEKEKILFDLIAVHNYTYKETGENLGLPERHVRYKYGLIVKRLVAYFNKRGIKSLEDIL
ncbi:MAG: sigma-70 family RNA polymerase sigma factor [bacterium]|nr:sigma-70 family RNA polymerase sigma factor [bacterium]